MAHIDFLSRVGLTLAALTALFMTAEPANAVVYCKTVGVPKGCVARPIAPVARRAVGPLALALRGRRSPRHPHEPRWPSQSRRPVLSRAAGRTSNTTSGPNGVAGVASLSPDATAIAVG